MRLTPIRIPRSIRRAILIYLVDVAGSAPRVLLRADPAPQLTFAGWAADGNSLIARKVFPGTGAPGRAELWWVPVDSRQPRKLHEYRVSGDSGGVVALNPAGRRVAFAVAPDNKRTWDVWAMDNILQTLGSKK